MGVLYNSSSLFEYNISDDSLCIDEHLHTQGSTGYRNARYSRTARSQYHSILLLICHIPYSYQHQFLPHTGERIKSVEENGIIRPESSRLRAKSPTTTVQGQSVGGVDAQESVDALTDLFRRWHLGNAKQQRDPLIPKDTASFQDKAHPRPSSQASSQKELQNDRLEKPTKDDDTVIACQENSKRESQDDDLKKPTKDNDSIRAYHERPNPLSNLLDDEIHAADVPLPPSPSISPTLLVYRAKRGQENIASSMSKSDKRQRDDSGDDRNTTQMLVQFKKAKQRTRKAEVLAQSSDAGMVHSTVVVKLGDQQSKFDVPSRNRIII